MADTVKIGYRSFSIEPFPNGFCDKLDGQTDFENLTVRLNAGSLPPVKSCTLLHEILHVIWDDASLKDEDGEERVITALANGLSQVIRDNPDVIKFITQGLK